LSRQLYTRRRLKVEQQEVQEPEQAEVQVQEPERQRQEPGQAVQPREDWPRVPLQQRQ
jgi:hypothetical protein